MAPKKKETQKMSLGDFMQQDQTYSGASWADEVEDSYGSQPLPAAGRTGYSGYSRESGGFGGQRNEQGYSIRERDSYPQELPTKPPYTAHLGNLSYDATTETVSEFFEGCNITSVRIIEDRIEQRPKGFAYAEFRDLDGLKKALTLDGESFQGRGIRVKIADPPKDRDRGDRNDRGDSVRELGAWERKGPLADLPSRGNNDRREYGEGRRDFGEGRRGPREGGSDEGKPARDFNNLDWNTRKGPLSPLPQPERSGSRDSSRPRTNDGKRTDSFRGGERRASPATWGEGRQEGSRPPRGEFRDRPERAERPDRPERAPTAAELDNQWRNNMRPGRSAKSPDESRDGSEAPSSPAGPAAAALAPASRPKLNLQKRTVSEAPGATSPPPPSASDPKANPFGAARPIDTAAKEREIADKKEQLAKEKKEADEKAKEERRLAKEAAAKEAAEKATEAEKDKAADEAGEEQSEAVETTDSADAAEASKEVEDGASGIQKAPTKPREQVQNPKSRANDSGNWRSASGEGRGARGGYQNAPRGARGDGRGEGRGDSRGGRAGHRGDRGGRFEGGRAPRANGSSPTPGQQQPAKQGTAPGTPTTEESADPEGWTTVPAKGRRNQSTRA